MPTHTFKCLKCEAEFDQSFSITQSPSEDLPCKVEGCSGQADRIWGSPQILLRGDPDEIAPQHRLVDTTGMSVSRAARWGGMTAAQADRKERAYARHIAQQRKKFTENKQVGGRMTHSVPVELYHSKIKETGDKNYWSDPSNLNRHKSCKVS